MKRLLSFGVALGLGTASALSVVAQEVKDFTGHQPTSQELIDTLKPRAGAEAETGRRTRGFGSVANAPAPAGKPQCKPYAAAQRSRGIGTGQKAVSDAVALKVEFDFNSANLTPAAAKTLDELGKALTSDDLKGYCFVVEGYTDSVGSDGYNKKLSERRAESVVAYLTKQFSIDKDRLQPVGMGKTSPLASNDTEEGRQKNRRVQIANLGS
jgi:OOP family OmpA-OmpF porin